jgi:hypothetical protein
MQTHIAEEVAACLADEGRPLVVTDALRDWPAAREWTPELLHSRYGADQARFACALFLVSAVFFSCAQRR